MKTRNLIGLYSPYPQAGKSTFANLLCEIGDYKIVSIASSLKNVAKQFLTELEVSKTPEKDSEIMHGKTYRHILQSLANWGIQNVHPDIWSECAENKIRKLLKNGEKIIVDDVRTEADYKMIMSLSGYAVRIAVKDRPLVGDIKEIQTKSFGTEAMLEDKKFDMDIENPMSGILTSNSKGDISYLQLAQEFIGFLENQEKLELKTYSYLDR